MKKLIDFFKKLFGCRQVCPKCKNEPCKCELEVPAEHIRVVEEIPAQKPVSQIEFMTEYPKTEAEAATKPAAPKKKRAPRKKKSETVTK